MNLESVQTLVKDHPGLVLAIVIWTMIWKCLALWKASQRREMTWFVVIFIINTFGILDIIYYYFVGKNDDYLENSDTSSSE
jgi:hypothetical protein